MALTPPQIISPLDIATNGVLSVLTLDRTNDGADDTVVTPALSIATMGWIVFVEEFIEEVVEEVVSGGGFPQTSTERRKELKKKQRKRIKVWVYIDGERYEDVAYTSDLSTKLTARNIRITLDENKKPKIQILLPEIKRNE